MYEGKTRYIYFRRNRALTKSGTISVGYKINKGDTVTVAVTFCTPDVDAFNRKEARANIDNRIKAGHCFDMQCEGKAPTYAQMIEVAKVLLGKAVSNEALNGMMCVVIPGWAKRFIESGFKSVPTQDALKKQIVDAVTTKYGNFGVLDVFAKGTEIKDVVDYVLKLSKA